MKPLNTRNTVVMVAALAVLMCMTRFSHFGTAIHLPDASMAVFFLGGLYVRRHLAFLGFVALAGALDFVSVRYAGTSDFCITPAYSFLLPAYAVLWYAGRVFAGRLQASAGSLAMAAGVALLANTLSFVISNGAFYWLGGRYAEPHFAEYVARLMHWAPMFVRTSMAYVVVALVVHAVVARALGQRDAGRMAGA
ncbi:hypothetical protein [Aerolutibacter ruishenii]|uniref:Uncharacterized protein n=1 Tax=Aerolutibacter ruishenii TaxID=686800 RepID=A0A562M2J8_9GAMM|nr:hypothetical protein [Lysobacter ruishenii]TWI14146.1 hypothetical protein IP93_00138 [Lysobacter ruishenii]